MSIIEEGIIIVWSLCVTDSFLSLKDTSVCIIKGRDNEFASSEKDNYGIWNRACIIKVDIV